MATIYSERDMDEVYRDTVNSFFNVTDKLVNT